MRPFNSYIVVVLVVLALAPWPSAPVVAAPEFAAPVFESVWRRTEQPVVDGRAARPFLWGPAPLATLHERYDDGGTDGQRLVQYFDKGRLELTQPDTAAPDVAVIQGGALVRDLVMGWVQVGSNRVQVFDPAFIPVAGDGDASADPAAPRYADFSSEFLLGLLGPALGLPGPASAVGQPVTTIVQAGRRDERPATAEPRVIIGAYDTTSKHNIAAPFWDAFAAAGLVIDPITGQEQQAPLYDWRLLVGAPISEPAWTTVKVGGQETAMVIQLFERRVLSYTPGGPEGFQVEMSNSGQHAHAWRYGPAPTDPPTIGTAPLNTGRNTRPPTVAPVTPTTPVPPAEGVPPSINGVVAPSVGPGGTSHAMLALGFRAIELYRDEISVWLTAPSGRAISLNGPGASPVVLADERADGIVLVADTSQLGVGLWALTLQSFADADKKAIFYFRVTAEPRELLLTQVLNPLFWLGETGTWPTVPLEEMA